MINYRLRKVSLCDRDILRKRHTQTNYKVSYWVDEFDPGGQVSGFRSKKKTKQNPIGVSKQEYKVSVRSKVDARYYINGAD